MKTDKPAKLIQTPEPQIQRHMYTGVDRSALVSKLTTRVPYLLRNQMKVVASYPPFGYRTQTQMYSKCLVDFIKDRPWERGLKWRQATTATMETPLYHLHLEPLEVTGKQVTGLELKNRALELAEENGVNQAAFTLTFLWWVALHKHPFDDPKIMEPLLQVKGANEDSILK
jgi:hypothetical protein